MAIDATFNSILNEVQMSNLNFAIQLTPFAAYITLKKSTQVDKSGRSTTPSAPLFLHLQQAYRDQGTAQEEITRLKALLAASEQKCFEIDNLNKETVKKIRHILLSYDWKYVTADSLNNLIESIVVNNCK